jgi:single-stranded-DNA-specific exonuclease
MSRPWRLRSVDDDVVAQLADAQGLNPLVARVLTLRGFSDPIDIDQFLRASLADMPDPSLLADIRLAAERVISAIDAGEKVTVYGDYDVDGVTSSAVLALFCRDVFGVELDIYIPHRMREGYGLNLEAIDGLARAGTRVLVTVDNGSSAVVEIEHARSLGVDVIIIDHHQVSDPEPNAFAHLNPHREGCTFPYKGLAAVGVAFLVTVEMRRVLREREDERARGARPDRYLDLVALGTVADVAPLTGLNRAIVRYGVEAMKRDTRLGLRALMDISKTTPDAVTARDLGYRIGPRINAAGRLDDATRGLRVLMGQDEAMVRDLARQVEQQNDERRAIQLRMTEEARTQASSPEHMDRSVLVLASDDWHPGVVGIVASKMVEEFSKPAILLAEDGGLLKGSARSVAGLNIKAALDQCAPHLMRYGGHVAAAGMTLRPESLIAFRDTLNTAVETLRTGDGGPLPFDVDAELDFGRVGRSLILALERLAPFGQGNAAPVIMSRRVHGRARHLNGGHLKILLDGHRGQRIEGLAWNRGADAELLDGPIDILYTPERDFWRGRERLVLRVHDFRASEPS